MFKKAQTFFLFWIVSCCICQPLLGVPAEVIIIRHGEKPRNKELLYLDKKGEVRAAALAPYFMETKELLTFGRPAAVYAMQPREGHDMSERPIQTCLPTADALGLPLNTKYAHDKSPEMVKEIMNNPELEGKSVLICWEHLKIPTVAQQFGVKNPPSPWPGQVFDRTWVIQFNKDGSVKSFQNLPQRLLYGDSAE